MSVSPGAKDMQIQPNEAEKTMKPKVLTLVIIEKEGKVLLGMKKRGFGQGYYNGFGGKVETGETVEEAAARELEEEAGVVAVSMEKRGILTFHFDDNPQPWEIKCGKMINFGTQSSCKGDDFAGNFTFTTHTHWFPTLYKLCPSCKPHHLYLVTN
ncbi:hypothetical protein CY35_08G103800 [Sphagnum magellanicum]|nr:hypothetical protein CY35_08G103800 [Sphagnum magellanicum]KAH9555226.1 hypothetical protein CY35_08G103800 [Sphagnum magellanicum]